jgi:4'-phosphopantetheinyl transferase
VAIARGPPKSADISYKSTLKKIQFTEDEYNIGLHLPNVEFVDLSVEQLVLILQKALDCEHTS